MFLLWPPSAPLLSPRERIPLRRRGRGHALAPGYLGITPPSSMCIVLAQPGERGSRPKVGVGRELTDRPGAHEPAYKGRPMSPSFILSRTRHLLRLERRTTLTPSWMLKTVTLTLVRHSCS